MISFSSADDTPQEWLVDETEQWCKDRAIYIAVMDSIEVLDEKTKQTYYVCKSTQATTWIRPNGKIIKPDELKKA